jgi:hypothetical protein
MNGDFNVAVTELGRWNGDTVEAWPGQSRGGGKRLGTDLADELRKAMVAVDDKTEVYGPDKTRRVAGRTQREREDDALKVAKDTNADLVIYGNLGPTRGTFIPEMLISSRALAGLGCSTDLGRYTLGEIDLGGAADVDSNAVAEQMLRSSLVGQTLALTRAIYGLNAYAIRGGDRGEAQFQAALGEIAAAAPAQAKPGEAMIQVLLGNVTLADCVGRPEPGSPPTTLDAGLLGRAAAHYQRALDLEPDYPRAQVGLGETFYLRAYPTCLPRQGDVPTLRRAVEQYTLAQQSTEESFLANVQTKATFGLGRAHVCLLYAGEADATVEGIEGEFRSVISAYQSGNPLVADWAREAHIELGQLYPQLNSRAYPRKYETAAQEYLGAIQVGIDSGKVGVRVKAACEMLGAVEARIDDAEARPSRSTTALQKAGCATEYARGFQAETDRRRASPSPVPSGDGRGAGWHGVVSQGFAWPLAPGPGGL